MRKLKLRMDDTNYMSKAHIHSEPDLRLEPRSNLWPNSCYSLFVTKSTSWGTNKEEEKVNMLKKNNFASMCVIWQVFYCMANTGVIACQLWVKRNLSESLSWKKTSLHCQVFWAWILFHRRAIYFELVFGNRLLNITVGSLWSKLHCEIISLIWEV